jgi:hypothetical protein
MAVQAVFNVVVAVPMVTMAVPMAASAAVINAAKARSYVAYTPAADPAGIVIVGGTPYTLVTTFFIREYMSLSVVSVPAESCAVIVVVTVVK